MFTTREIAFNKVLILQKCRKEVSLHIRRSMGHCLITVTFITGIAQRGLLGRNITTGVEQYHPGISMPKNIKYVQHIIRSGQRRFG